jgi:hypothetical protein
LIFGGTIQIVIRLYSLRFVVSIIEVIRGLGKISKLILVLMSL